MAATGIPAAVTPGQVVATECCYGTAHWPPSAANGQAGVAMTYLAHGAAGVFGSSTVAYGPATTNDYADVICRLFLEQVLGGASIGRAALVARQRFIQSQAFLDPTDVKTLAQVRVARRPVGGAVHGADVGAAAPKAMARRAAVAPTLAPASVMARRETLSAVGAALDRTTMSCSPTARRRAGMSRRDLAQVLGRSVPSDTVIRTFDAERAGGPLPAARAPRAQVAFLPATARQPASLVVVREEPTGGAEVREVLRR